MQTLEGAINSSHVPFLRHGNLRHSLKNRATTDTAPRFETAQTDYGTMIGTKRRISEHENYWRNQWMAPWYTIIPRHEDLPFGAHARVPTDDHHRYVWSLNWHPDRPLTDQETADREQWTLVHAELIPGTLRPVLNKDNDYLIDREPQGSDGSYTGINGLGTQTKPSRKAWARSATALRRRSRPRTSPSFGSGASCWRWRRKPRRARETPAPRPASYRVRSAGFVLPAEDLAWPEATQSYTEGA